MRHEYSGETAQNFVCVFADFCERERAGRILSQPRTAHGENGRGEPESVGRRGLSAQKTGLANAFDPVECAGYQARHA